MSVISHSHLQDSLQKDQWRVSHSRNIKCIYFNYSPKQCRCELLFFFNLRQISHPAAENAVFSLKGFVLKCRFRKWWLSKIRRQENVRLASAQVHQLFDRFVVNRFSYMFSHFEPFQALNGWSHLQAFSPATIHAELIDHSQHVVTPVHALKH